MIDSFTGLLLNSPLKIKLIKYTGFISKAYLQQQNPS
jgi:hypothetical protein